MRITPFRRFIASPAFSRFFAMSSSSLSAAALDDTSVSSATSYVPPKVWTWETSDDNKFASLNRPTAGARFDRKLPVGKHALQLYSLATPNGQKVTILLEELLAAGVREAEYDAWTIRIMDQDQFGNEFVAINPNSKIPALLDRSNKSQPEPVFESGSILLYLAEKFQGQHSFLPASKRTQVLNWLFWQMGAAPYVGGGFGHFYAYAHEKQEYPINRFTMETKRQLDVLNNQLRDNKFIVGDQYTIADIAIFPWYGLLVLGESYGDAATFLNVQEDYPHVIRWAREVSSREAVQRGRIVNKTWGDGAQLAERHAATDIDQALQDAQEEEEEEAASSQ